MTMFAKLNAVLVDDWTKSYKWLSMQLAGVVSLLAWFLSEYPTVLISTAQMWMQIPDQIRTALGPVVGIALLLIIALARLWQQKKPPVA